MLQVFIRAASVGAVLGAVVYFNDHRGLLHGLDWLIYVCPAYIGTGYLLHIPPSLYRYKDAVWCTATVVTNGLFYGIIGALAFCAWRGLRGLGKLGQRWFRRLRKA